MSEAVRETAAETTMETGSAVVRDPTGLHARPAVKLTKLAKSFGAMAEVRAQRGENWVNAKSPNAVMKLKVAHGETISIRASGVDAAAAIAALVGLIERDFDG